ncbi:thioredoxin family protein [Pseudonocardia asaccharolytica]|uniref:Thioredoxin n=1 Tax=Pseudonocardia asaccharolytica DSM 44247 = NBRC 16224 TaxID=1123024 RepID=A0A511D2N7_9PSEU|nr:thioredoxin domain-containing protein [Pseudonocardia asaccharolytica]GEL19055.1 thioredoxin [Pseudonocardia asaccharolytica DSM 44247 = NBRC 16224]
MTSEARNHPVAAVRPVTEDEFAREVLESPTPVLVRFGAEWCGPCRTLGPTLDAIAAEHPGRLRVVSVDVDTSPALARRYRIWSIPAMLLFSGGTVVERIRGARNPTTILRKIGAHLP